MKLSFKRTLITESAGTTFLQDKDAIAAWLNKYEIKNFEIHDDFTVTIHGPFTVAGQVTEIPVKLRASGSVDVTANKITRIDWAPEVVNGDFDCWDNEIETLEGGPKKVTGSFDCDANKLRDLVGAPEEVEGSFICSSNNLQSLKGAPRKVGRYFKAQNCGLEAIDALPEEVGTNIYLQQNAIRSVKGINKLVRSLGAQGQEGKTGVINLEHNPIENGLLSLMIVKGIKNIKYAHKDRAQKPIDDIIARLNRALQAGTDPLDVQDELIDNGLAQHS